MRGGLCYKYIYTDYQTEAALEVIRRLRENGPFKVVASPAEVPAALASRVLRLRAVGGRRDIFDCSVDLMLDDSMGRQERLIKGDSDWTGCEGAARAAYRNLLKVAEQESPAKGDTAYIAASFKGVVPASRLQPSEGTLPACARVVVQEANFKKGRWPVEDPVSAGRLQLDGAWLPKMHRDEATCRSQFAAEGQPAVARSGEQPARFKILEAASK